MMVVAVAVVVVVVVVVLVWAWLAKLESTLEKQPGSRNCDNELVSLSVRDSTTTH